MPSRWRGSSTKRAAGMKSSEGTNNSRPSRRAGASGQSRFRWMTPLSAIGVETPGEFLAAELEDAAVCLHGDDGKADDVAEIAERAPRVPGADAARARLR